MRGRVSKRVYAPVMIKPCKYRNFILEANTPAKEKQPFRVMTGLLTNICFTPYQQHVAVYSLCGVVCVFCMIKLAYFVAGLSSFCGYIFCSAWTVWPFFVSQKEGRFEIFQDS